MRTGLSLAAVVITVASIVALAAAAVWLFRRRDIGT